MKEKKPPTQANQKRKPKSLTTEDSALWQHVTKDVAKLHHNAAPKESPSARKTKTTPKTNRPTVSYTTIQLENLKPAISDTKNASSYQMDKTLQKKFSNGDLPIDGKLDLHGMTLDTAHKKFIQFMRSHIRDGSRFLLVVTGKGTGALQRHLPQWCDTSEFSNAILQTRAAKPAHGGTGAMYISLRQKK